jgi:hypothetical protein
MSTEDHKSGHGAGEPPTHADVSFESTDVKTGTILAYLFYLALAVAVTFLISILILRFTTNMAVQLETPPPPVRQGAGKILPPEPRLQGVPGHEVDPQQDLRDKIKADTEANKKLGWIDQKAGIAQIPVEEAMKIIARKGLPGVPAAPAENKKEP